MWSITTNGTGNPSSTHYHGRLQSSSIGDARDQVASLVGGRPSNTIFTASATEANNLVLFGLLNRKLNYRNTILVSAVEHSSVFETARWIKEKGLAKVGIIPATKEGAVDLDRLDHLVDSDTLLVSVMAANSETGVLNPIPKVSEIAHSRGALFHCDATQMVSRLHFDIENSGCDFVSVSSHKIHGPTGVGALIGSHSSLNLLEPVIHGGGHERGLRSGSLNTIGIVGFGTAAEIAVQERQFESSSVRKLRDHLVSELKTRLHGVDENGDVENRLPNTSNIRFRGASADAVMVNLEPVSVSIGSACSSGAIEPSRVLLAMGVSRECAYESIRFSLGRFTTREEIDQAIDQTVYAVEFVRNMTEKMVV